MLLLLRMIDNILDFVLATLRYEWVNYFWLTVHLADITVSASREY